MTFVQVLALYAWGDLAPGQTAVVEFTPQVENAIRVGLLELDGEYVPPDPQTYLHQPLDADLTAIADQGTLAYGRSLLLTGDAPSARTLLGISSTPTVLNFKEAVVVASTANIPSLSGTKTIDGQSAGIGARVLLKDQTTGAQNGIYVVAAGAWARATDADADAEVTAGMTVPVVSGTVNGGRVFLLTTPDPIVVGTTALTFVRINAGDLAAANNLSDLANAATARTNLGLGTAATTAATAYATAAQGAAADAAAPLANVYTKTAADASFASDDGSGNISPTSFRTALDSRYSQKANNLSDVASASTALANLGGDSIAVAVARSLLNGDTAVAVAQLRAQFLGAAGGVFIGATTPTANNTATTLAATANIGATSISLTATLTPGRYVIGSETVTITGVPTGSGPYTAPLAAATTAQHLSGVAVATAELDYQLIRGIGSGRFEVRELTWKTGNPPAYNNGLNQLGKVYLANAMLSINEESGTVTRAGTWSGTNAQALAYGGIYRYTTATGATASWTSPAVATSLGIRIVRAGNGGGLFKVSIDGSLTAANLCLTAQQVVDSGLYPNTILIANGGTLNPTDRVVSCYSSTLNYDILVPLADGLTSATHAVILTSTGYQATAASGNRCYLAAFSYCNDTITPVTSTATMFPTYSIHDEASVSSAWEYADQENPASGSTSTFIGNIHGYERQDSIAISTSYTGTPVTLTAGTITAVGTGGLIRVVRSSTMFHPDTGTTPTKTCVTTYTLSRQGLLVTATMTYLVAMHIVIAYIMMPGNGVLSTTGVPLDRVALSDFGPITLPGNVDTRYGMSRSVALWAWNSTNKVGQLMYLPDAYSTIGDWSYSGNGSQFQDRAGILTKAYVTIVGNVVPLDLPAGTVKSRSARYLANYFSGGAEAALANL